MEIEITYPKEFCDLWERLKRKYPSKLFDLEGIGKQTDLEQFSKKFFGDDTQTTADASVDANSNVDDLTVVAYENELPKPYTRLNSLALLWKYGKANYGKEFADNLVEQELVGDYYINDMSCVQKPYSYHPDTMLFLLRDEDTERQGLRVLTMKKLFKDYESRAVSLDDREEIDLSNENIRIADYTKEGTETSTKITRVLRHKTKQEMILIVTYGGYTTMVTEDHPVILDDWSEKPASQIKEGDKLLYKGNWAKDSGIVRLYCEEPSKKSRLNIALKTLGLNYQELQDHLMVGHLCGRKYDVTLTRCNENSAPCFEVAPISSIPAGHAENEVKDIWHLPFPKNGYVYDITTESGHFYCQGLVQHNCFNFSTMDVLQKGLPFVQKIPSQPPKHLSSFAGQMIHFTSYASNQIMGAVGLADLLIVMSYYVKKEFAENPLVPDEYLWRQVKQEIQSLIYSMNQPFRGGLQSGFYNVSVYDHDFLVSLQDNYLFPDGETFDIPLVQRLQDIFLDTMNETMEIRPITFPVTTACFCVDDERNILDKEFLEYIAKKNQRWGFINIYAGESSTLSSCCRLRSKRDNQYLGYTNSFGSGSTQIGSFGVVTLNLPRAAQLALKCPVDEDPKEAFLDRVRDMAECAIKINDTKRAILIDRIQQGALPLYTYGFMDLQKQYATIGLNGIYEAVEILGESLLEPEGQKLCSDLLSMINEINDQADERYHYAHNVEQTPSENSAIKLAQKDDLLDLQHEYKLYSNQFIPLIATANMLDRIRLQGMFDAQFSGGSIMHINCDSRVDDYHNIMDMIETTVKNGCVYHAINYNLQKCKNDHMNVGKSDHCAICGAPITDNYIRVVGFIVNVKNFHQVRREEDYAHRQFYSGRDIAEVND